MLVYFSTFYFPGTKEMVHDLKIFEDDRQMKQSVSSIDVGHHHIFTREDCIDWDAVSLIA